MDATANNSSHSQPPYGVGVGGGAGTILPGDAGGTLDSSNSTIICPYAAAAATNTSSSQQQRLGNHFSNNHHQRYSSNTLGGRLKNLEMTEYQKQKLLNEANTVRIKVSMDYCYYQRLC